MKHPDGILSIYGVGKVNRDVILLDETVLRGGKVAFERGILENGIKSKGFLIRKAGKKSNSWKHSPFSWRPSF